MPSATSPTPKFGSHYVLRKGISHISDLVDGNAAYGYPGDYIGRIYYVNNISGASTNDGLSWAFPFAQVDQALEASEEYRHSHATNNKMLRNIIYVQGTETAYSKMDQDFNGADLIGIGTRAHLGGAAGDVMVSGAGAADGWAMTDLLSGWDTTINKGGGLGINVFNMHFEATGNYFAADLEDCLLSSIEDCTFMCSGSNSYGGLNVTQHFAGCRLIGCHAGGDAGLPQDGFSFTGGVFNQNYIAHNWAQARRYGFYTTDYLQGGTLVEHNTFYGTTYGLYDNSAETTVLGLAQYSWNICNSAGTGMQVTNGSTTRCTGNMTNNNGTIDWAYTLAAQ